MSWYPTTSQGIDKHCLNCKCIIPMCQDYCVECERKLNIKVKLNNDKYLATC